MKTITDKAEQWKNKDLSLALFCGALKEKRK